MPQADEKPKRVIGYARVSTKDQAERGMSLEVQDVKIRGYCTVYDLFLVDILAEDASGKSLNRPKLQHALRMLEAGEVDGLIVAKLDRLSRRVRDLGELVDDYFSNGLLLVSVAEQVDTRTAMGRFGLNLTASLAQLEREQISERTKETMAHKRASRQLTSYEPPYGTRIIQKGSKQLEENPEEQKVIRMVQQYHAQGRSIRDIVQLLKKRGIVSRSGKPLGVTQVYRIVKGARNNS